MLYDRRHTHLISEFGGLATPMPVFSSVFLFVCLSSLGLPMLNGFVGEFLILVGVFGVNVYRAVAAALGVNLSAVYLLWMYQRTVFGGVTQERNRALPDLNWREKAILIPIAVMILWMGVASPMFTSRMEASTQQLIQQMEPAAGYRLAQK
jgi:NADH-quinone oxidoreductase subunit M